MAVEVTALCWPVKLTPPQKLVLLKLADHANGAGGEARPSLTRIESETGLARSTVQKSLKELTLAGIISLERPANLARQQPASYRLDLDRLRALAPTSERRKGTYAVSPDGIGSGANGAKSAEPIPPGGPALYREAGPPIPPGVQPIPPGGPKPSLTVQESHPPRARVPAAPADDSLKRLVEEIWITANRGSEMDRWRAGGKVDDFRIVGDWLKRGWTPEEIAGCASRIVGSAGEIRSLWGLLAKAMPEEIDKRRASGRGGSDTGNLVAYSGRHEQWRARCRSFQHKGIWLPQWGPKPDEPGCEAPTEVLTELEITPAMQRTA